MSTLIVSAASQAERIATGRLWWVGPLAVITSVVANSIVRVIAVALFDISPEFAPLAWGPLIFLTVAGVTGAVIVFAVVSRFSRRPIRLFRIIAAVTLLLSFTPAFALLAAKPFPGTNARSAGTLMLMHVVAATISVGLLEKLTREK